MARRPAAFLIRIPAHRVYNFHSYPPPASAAGAMREVALSQSNLDQLRLCKDTPHTTDLNEAAQRLCKAANGESRRTEALQLFAILSSELPTPTAGASIFWSLVHSGLSLTHVVDHATHALTAELALASLHLLCDSDFEPFLDDRALLYIIAYTDTRDSWTTHSSSLLATSLVASYESARELNAFITGPLLHGYLRPLLSGSSARVTAAGRPAHFPLPIASYSFAERSQWKKADPPVAPLLRWATDRAHPDLIVHHWPLFLPGLLTLIEDNDVNMKDEGLRILSVFLNKVPSEILFSTGTGRLLEHAVSSMLHFLPGSTNDQDCVNVLRQAYHILFRLADVDRDPSGRAKRLRYDKIVSDGIIASQFHTSQNPVIVEVLISNITSAISSLGIFAARHLQSLLGIIESVMTDPFAFSHPPSVMAAARMLHTILLSCWPRIVSNAAYAGQLYRIIAVCWLGLHDGKGATDAGDQISQQLKQSAALLHVLWRGQQPDALTEVFCREPRLRSLFLVDP